MLSPRWRKIARDLWLHKSRSLLVVLAIAIGITGAGIVLNAWALVEVATQQGYLASNPASATLRLDSVDAAVLDQVRALPGIAEVQARRTVIGRVQANGAWRTGIIYVHDDFGAMRIGVVRPEVGAWPPADNAIVIERSSLDFSGASVGSPITLQLGDGTAAPASVAVSGVARDVGLAPGWMEHVVYGFMNRRTAAALGAPATLNELQIAVRDKKLDRDGVRRIAYAMKSELERSGHRVNSVEVPVPGQHIHAAQMDSLLLTQGAFGVLALVLSGFLVVNLIAAMLAGQVREIGIMKAIGAGAGQVAAMYLSLALALGIVATAIAIPIASSLGARYATLKADLLNFDLTGYGIPWWVTALQIVAGLVLPVAAALIPVVRGCRIPVSAAIRDVGIDARSAAGGGIVFRVGGLTRPILLSLRNAFRRRQRMVLTLLTLGTGGAVFLGALNLKAAIRDAVDRLFAPQRYDLALRLTATHAADSIEATIRGVPGIAAAETWSSARGAASHGDGTLGNAFAITAPPVPSALLAFPVTAGRWLTPADTNAIVVSRSLIKDDSTIALGRVASLIVSGRVVRWTVVGIVDAGPSPSAYAPREVITSLAGNRGMDLAVVRLSSSDDAAGTRFETIRRVRSDLADAGMPVASGQLLEENRRVMEDHLLMVADFLGGMAWLMIVVGGLALASTMSLAVLERTREIGVLRAIGARHRSILAMIQVEGLVVGVLSWAIALPLSLPMSVVLGRAFGRVMLPVADRLVPEPSGVLWWLGLVVVVSILACAWPAVRAMRISTRAALAYE